MQRRFKKKRSLKCQKLQTKIILAKIFRKYILEARKLNGFLKCEACALAELNGEWEEETSKAMLVSSYIDAVISDEGVEFEQQNPEIFTKGGNLKAEYRLAEDVFNQMQEDEMFMKYLRGEHQVIMTGEISGVPIKIKIDSYHKDKAIVDLKCMANFDLIWNEATHQKENFVDYYDYLTQASLYQEVVRQNTGKQLPFIIAAATKQKYSQRALLQIPQEKMDLRLEFLKQYLPHLQEVKQGKVKPTSCGKCDYCISKKKCDRIYYYDDFWNQEIKF